MPLVLINKDDELTVRRRIAVQSDNFVMANKQQNENLWHATKNSGQRKKDHIFLRTKKTNTNVHGHDQ